MFRNRTVAAAVLLVSDAGSSHWFKQRIKASLDRGIFSPHLKLDVLYDGGGQTWRGVTLIRVEWSLRILECHEIVVTKLGIHIRRFWYCQNLPCRQISLQNVVNNESNVLNGHSKHKRSSSLSVRSGVRSTEMEQTHAIDVRYRQLLI